MCTRLSGAHNRARRSPDAAKLSRDLDRRTALKRECMAIIGELAALAHSSMSYAF